MSSSTVGQSSSSSSNFKTIFDTALSHALTEYSKKTGHQLLDHPLATELQRCGSADAILTIFRGQAEEFQQFKDGDQRLMKWLSPVVDVLYTFSETLGGVAATAFPPAGAIFTGIGVLLAAAKDVRASHDVLVELFERIQGFFNRLGIYTQVSLTTEMAEILVKIVAEVLSILSIATKEVKRKRATKYFRSLLGKTEIKDAFKKLDNLIQEEVWMASAQTMKDSKNADDNINEIMWNQIEQAVRSWFSPPDPSTNHNTTCEVYHKEPPTWFFEADMFKDWMSNGSLMWVHGKPGSGKSVVCSAVIQFIMTLRDAGKVMLAYFYFDFRDEEKQNVRNFVISLLVQFSAYSKPCCDLIYQLYSVHGKGTQQPSMDTLIECLKEMLTDAAKHPIFIITDALDECPDSGLPTPRETVLNLMKDLVHLRLPNLRIFVTSRPEVDIQAKLKPLTVNTISLHGETRQQIVISNYISSVVSSDERMRKWRDEDKKLVIKELSERAGGMFQWVFCQLETLRHVVQPDVRAIIEALPRTLDETYRRMLKNINEHNRKHARLLLHCLAVAARPLRVEELAEIFTFDFNGTQGGIPKFHAERRPNDQEEAVLSTCSSLISVIDNGRSRVVQFSHLSVKEFLTSTHLASSAGDLSLYHILPGHAHTILAQVCLGLLLHLDDRNYDKSVRVSPLVQYAAQHWVAHARFGDVASHVMDGMVSLFDPDKPHFSAWIGLYDMDKKYTWLSTKLEPTPLYYSALCGFRDLVQHLVIKHPQHVNAIGGAEGFPLSAAVCRNDIKVMEILLKHGGNVDIRDARGQTALHKTLYWKDEADIAMQLLLEHGADVNARRDDLWTPLHLALYNGKLTGVQILLDNQVDVNSQNDDGQAPLHLLSRRMTSPDEDASIAKLLLERGANVNERDKNNVTPLHLASYFGKSEVVRVLLDSGANANAVTVEGRTPMHQVSCGEFKSANGVRVTQQLLECGVDVNAQDKYHITPLRLACNRGRIEIARLILDRGATLNAEADSGETQPSSKVLSETNTESLFVDGYISQAFQRGRAEHYFHDLLKSNSIPPIETLTLHSRESRFFFVNQITQHVIEQPFDTDTSPRLLDCAVVNRGTVVPQIMWSPHTVTNRRLYVHEAILHSPIFFVGSDGRLGLSLEASAAGRCHDLCGAQSFALLGRKSTTHIRIIWPGYKDFKRQVQIRDETNERNLITISRFAHHIGRSVDAFLKSCEAEPRSTDSRHKQWQIGPHGIQRSDIVVIGAIHVSLGSWTPILQLSRYIL